MTDVDFVETTSELSDELDDLDTTPLSAYVHKGVLSHHLGAGQVNIINALYLAKQRDIQLVFQKSLFSQSSSSEITLRLQTTEEKRWVTGSAVPGIGERLRSEEHTSELQSRGH